MAWWNTVAEVTERVEFCPLHIRDARALIAKRGGQWNFDELKGVAAGCLKCRVIATLLGPDESKTLMREEECP